MAQSKRGSVLGVTLGTDLYELVSAISGEAGVSKAQVIRYLCMRALSDMRAGHNDLWGLAEAGEE